MELKERRRCGRCDMKAYGAVGIQKMFKNKTTDSAQVYQAIEGRKNKLNHERRCGT